MAALLLRALLLLLVICVSGTDAAQDAAQPEAGGHDAEIRMEHLRDLIIDLAAFHSCDRLKGKLMELSGEPGGGSETEAPVIGMLRVTGCRSAQQDQHSMEIEVEGNGWRWIQRKKEKAGAEFHLSENVKFKVNMRMAGTFDAAYDRERHIATAWFLLTEPVKVRFDVLNDVEVDTRDLWSSILGGAASVFMASPEEQAEQTIEETASSTFESKLENGLSLVVDLCSGERFVEFGKVRRGQLPEKKGATDAPGVLVDSQAVMHGENMLMAGPYTIEKPLAAEVSVDEGGAVNAAFLCEAEARRMADAYLSEKPLKPAAPPPMGTARPGQKASFDSDGSPGCPLVFIAWTGEAGEPAHVRYVVNGEETGFEPLMRCPEKPGENAAR